MHLASDSGTLGTPGSSPPEQAAFGTQAYDDRQDQSKAYPSGLKFAAITIAICLLFTLIGLDGNIIATAVPAMTRYFGTTRDIAWYTSIYRLTAGSFQLIFGKLYTMMPAKPLLLANLAIFATGTLLCALAPSSPVFILGRAITGIATAAVVAGVFAMILYISPLRKRSTYAGIGAATEATASLLAPLLGGLLTDRLSWRWCFFIQLPLVIAAITLIVSFLDMSVGEVAGSHSISSVLRKLDIMGMVIFMPAMSLLILALQWGGQKYKWSDWPVVLPLCLFATLLCLFIWHQSRLGQRATVPLHILRRRNVLFGFLFSFCNNGSLNIVEYYMPIYFQTVKRFSAFFSGIMVLPTAAGLVVSVPLAGYLTTFTGYYSPLMLLTSLLTPPATGLLTTLDAGSKVWEFIFYQALLGTGVGIGFQGPQVAVQAIISEPDALIGITVIQLAQALGPVIAVAGAQTIFSSTFNSYLSRFLPSGKIGALGSDGLKISPSLSPDEQSLVVSAYAAALSRAFNLSLALACSTIIGALFIGWRKLQDTSVES